MFLVCLVIIKLAKGESGELNNSCTGESPFQFHPIKGYREAAAFPVRPWSSLREDCLPDPGGWL